MTTQSTAQAFVVTTDMATLVREGAAKERGAFAAKKKAAEAIASAGGRGHFFTKESVNDGLISAETFAGLQGEIAAGLLTKAEFTLWAAGAKAAKAAGKQDERNALTSNVSKYLASFRAMIETAWIRLNPEAAEAEALEAEEADDKEEKESLREARCDVRAVLKALILEFAGMPDAPNREQILADLNHAESLMTW